MTKETQKEKILAAIASRGWMMQTCFLDAANELRAEGKIRSEIRYSAVGAIRCVWVGA